MITKPFSAVVLSSVIASAFVPITATAQTEPAEGTIATTVAAVTKPEGRRFKSCPCNQIITPFQLVKIRQKYLCIALAGLPQRYLNV